MHAFTIFLSSFASLCGAAILARPVVPKPPSVPKPVVPKPVVPIPRPLEPIVPGSGQQPDVVVRSNIQHLEDRLKRVGDGIDFGVELVDAILGDEATTMTMSGNPGSALVTPTTTSLITPPTSPTKLRVSLQSCSSYASILSSCASVTTSFYNLSKTDQASCACYTTSSSAQPSCTVVVQMEANSYDGYEEECYNMFKEFNFSSIADAMNNIATLPGKGLCTAMGSQTASGTASRLPPVLATTTEGSCAVQTASAGFTSGAEMWKGRAGAVSILVVGFAAVWGLLA